MNYAEEKLRKILEQNKGELPEAIVRDLEQRVEKKGLEGLCGIPFPVIEVDGHIKMLNGETLQYFVVPDDIAENYRKRRQAKEQGCCTARTFWENFSIRAAYISMINALKEARDPRVKSLHEIHKKGKEEYAKRTKQSAYSNEAEIAGARAVFEHVEGEQFRLYDGLQKYMKWFNSGKSR